MLIEDRRKAEQPADQTAVFVLPAQTPTPIGPLEREKHAAPFFSQLPQFLQPVPGLTGFIQSVGQGDEFQDCAFDIGINTASRAFFPALKAGPLLKSLDIFIQQAKNLFYLPDFLIKRHKNPLA
jgi:hypothetical protein